MGWGMAAIFAAKCRHMNAHPPTAPGPSPRRGTFKIPESVLVVVHSADAEVLLIQRADVADFWQSVTGAKDWAEEPFEATAARELWEETGLVAGRDGVLSDWGLENIYAIYPQWRHRYRPGVSHNTERVFGFCVSAPVPVRLSPREHTAQCWLPWRAAAERCFSPSNAEAILWLPRFLAPEAAPAPAATQLASAADGGQGMSAALRAAR